MQKSVIYLSATLNHGKTTVIKGVYTKLVSEKYGYKVAVNEKIVEDCKKIKSNVSLIDNKNIDLTKKLHNKDIKDIITIVAKGNIKIGILSLGDPGTKYKKFLEILIKYKCNIILCACRTRGKVLNGITGIKEYSKYGFIPHYHKKKDDDEGIKTVNKQNIKIVLGIIEKILTNS